MKLFMFWTTLAIVVAGWNTAKYNGYDPIEVTKQLYSDHLQEKKVVDKVVERNYPNTFEHLHKHTE